LFSVTFVCKKYYYTHPDCPLMSRRRIAIYGKGGIGKSTTASNLSAALSSQGVKVMQVGCDPKADSTSLLLNGRRQKTILDACREGEPVLDEIVRPGFAGVLCAECGGPRPGVGCAGRGIITAFETLDRLEAFDTHRPDVVIYDVLGDVVCGGFAMPIRNGHAREVYVVSSGERMSAYAAGNIAEAIGNFRSHGYARLCGVIQNSRGIEDEAHILDGIAADMGSRVVDRIPRHPAVQDAEAADMTVMEHSPDGDLASIYRRLADSVMKREVESDE